MNERREIRSAEAPEPIGPYSQAIASGSLVFLSGQIGLRDGEMVAGGAQAEARVAFMNLRAVLAAAGCQVTDIVRTTLFLADMADFAAVNACYEELLTVPGVPAPARSTVAVAGLPRGARVEIDAIATRRPT